MQLGSNWLEGLRLRGQRDGRRLGARTQDDHGLALPQLAVVGDVELVAVDVAIGDGHDAGIATDAELQFILVGQHGAPLGVDGAQADVLQVLAADQGTADQGTLI